MIAQRTITVNQTGCENHVCSASLHQFPLNNSVYSVVVTANSAFNSSSESMPYCKQLLFCLYHFSIVLFIFQDVISTIEDFFSLNLMHHDCLTTAACSTTLSEMGNCTLQYGQEQNLEYSIISSAFNTFFDLPLMDSSTLYYFNVTFMLNSQQVFLRQTFTTGTGT